jgi:NADPH:quinone reductase-like Zn-dependent oxidoreductase
MVACAESLEACAGRDAKQGAGRGAPRSVAARREGGLRAVVLTRYGGVEGLEIREVSRPAPGPGQVLLRVRAAGVNPIDWKIRKGSLRLVVRTRLPAVLGFDVAGDVEAVGPEVEGFEPGDPVFAMLDGRHGGGYAEYAVAGGAAVAHKPEELSYEEAAAIPLAGLTALQALRDLAGIERGDRLAVLGAAGGVGHLAVQIGAAMGARVTAVAGPRHQDFVRGLGAERAVDRAREDFTHGDETYEAIFDAVGMSDFARCDPLLVDGGIYMTTSIGPAIFVARLRTALAGRLAKDARRARWVKTRPSGRDLELLAELARVSLLRPAIERVYLLEDVREAHAASEAGHVRGKLVLRVEPVS